MSEQKGLLAEFAGAFALSEQQMKHTLIRTVFPGGQPVSDEQFVQFIAVAKQYGLNPFVKEIYAFPAKGGGIQPIVSIDGWLTMINRHPQMDGLETVDVIEGGALVAITAKIYIKDRKHPVTVTEYMAECKRATDPWKQWPARMLRHKAVIQCARYAFGFSGIMDEDEYDRMQSPRDITQSASATVIEQSALIDEVQLSQIRDMLAATGSDEAQFAKVCKVTSLDLLPASKFDGAMEKLRQKLAGMEQRQ